MATKIIKEKNVRKIFKNSNRQIGEETMELLDELILGLIVEIEIETCDMGSRLDSDVLSAVFNQKRRPIAEKEQKEDKDTTKNYKHLKKMIIKDIK